MRAQAELQYDGDYDDVCDASSQSGKMFRDARADVPLGTMLCLDENARVVSSAPGNFDQGAIDGAGSGVDSNGNVWAAALLLNSSGDWFCVDSSGAAKLTPGVNPLAYSPTLDKTC